MFDNIANQFSSDNSSKSPFSPHAVGNSGSLLDLSPPDTVKRKSEDLMNNTNDSQRS